MEDRTLWDGVSIIFDLTLLSVRNLSNIAHTRDCIALNQCSEPVEKRANLQSAPRQVLSLLLRSAADSRAKRSLAKGVLRPADCPFLRRCCKMACVFK